MSVSKRAFDYRENIRTRVDNWAQGEGYGPGGFSRDTAEHDVVFLLNHIAALEEEVDDLKEAAVPRTVEGDGSDLPAGTVVIDKIGDAWRRYRLEGWVPTGDGPYDSLPESGGPYTIVYTPTPKENTND